VAPQFLKNFLQLVNITIMGFNKKYVPTLEQLKTELEQYPKNLRYYLKSDALIGPADSIAYLKELAKRQQTMSQK